MIGLEFYDWELGQRLSALNDEITFWKSETAKNDLKRHQSQVREFAKILNALKARIEPTPANPVKDPADARERSKVVLSLFRIWQFLRGKLSQRSDARFREFLWLADEFAWLCYKPIYDAGLKEPPLVFLNGGYSPYTLTRQEAIQAESVPKDLLRSESLLKAMASLPFPVIGVPWYQVNNLIDLPVIGHEVGHSVEADLGLDEAIRSAIAGAVQDGERRPKWTGWASEVFADLYGCLGSGPAFVGALASFLSSEDPGAKEADYPPPSLRFCFNLEALHSLHYETDADALARSWQAAYQIQPAWSDYAQDARNVANAILDITVTGGNTIRGLIPFDQDYLRVKGLIDAVERQDSVGKGEPLRALVAAYRLAFDKLVAGHDAKNIKTALPRLDRLEKAMRASLVPDTRAGEVARPPAQLQAQDEAAQQRADFWLQQLRG